MKWQPLVALLIGLMVVVLKEFIKIDMKTPCAGSRGDIEHVVLILTIYVKVALFIAHL